MNFVWVNISKVNTEVINAFDSGNYRYNEWLYNDLLNWQSIGEMSTYVAVRSDEYDLNNITKIYAYVSISATGLMAESKDKVEYLSCCEIRLFAIHRGLRGSLNENFVPYSVVLFKLFLQDLYEMSTSIIGFKAIYLNSNNDGYHLYTDESIGFMEPSGFIPSTDEEKLDIDGCTPLLFFFDDDGIYKIFE